MTHGQDRMDRFYFTSYRIKLKNTVCPGLVRFRMAIVMEIDHGDWQLNQRYMDQAVLTAYAI